MRAAAVTAALAAVLATAAPAAAAEPLRPYDGTNPFACVLQDAGRGTQVPQPDADPLCVEYDKTHQDLASGGVVAFLAGEPARFALAADKCFYFQHDHWRGSVEQHHEQSETYNWDGAYFLDRARGVGGAYVENFTFNNASADPTGAPGFPEAWKPFFGWGRGGLQTTGSIPVEPRCAERAAREPSVYRRPEQPGERTAAGPPPRPALRLRIRSLRGCRVHVRLTGGKARGVRRLDVRRAGRTVRRDARAPFTAVVRRSRRGRTVRVSATARLAQGGRVLLARRIAPCRSAR